MKGFPARHSETRDELVLPGTQQGILPDGCRAKASTLPKPLSRCNISHVLYINPVCIYISFAPTTNWTQGHLTVQTAHCALHCTTNKLGQICWDMSQLLRFNRNTRNSNCPNSTLCTALLLSYIPISRSTNSQWKSSTPVPWLVLISKLHLLFVCSDKIEDKFNHFNQMVLCPTYMLDWLWYALHFTPVSGLRACSNGKSISLKGIVHNFFLWLNLIFWDTMGCGIAHFGRRGLEST